MVDFRKFMSPDQIARSDAERAEILRMWALPDRFLAADLLRKVRIARNAYPVLNKDYRGSTYETTFAWDVVPEVAARLGATEFLPNERKAEVRQCSDEELREWVGLSLKHMGMIREAWLERDDRPNPWLMLTHSLPNGNPVAFAMDRVCPPTLESRDWLAVHVREVAHHRGFDGVSAWSPMLQDWERSQHLSGIDDDEDVLHCSRGMGM